MALKSRPIIALVLATVLAVLVNANPINVHFGRDPGYNPAPDGRPNHGWGKQKAKAVYFMTNLAPNAVVALPVVEDGSVSAGTTTYTGGAGGNLVDAKKGTPNGPDALGSQGSVQVAGDMLFAVNAGSNSVSMFKISWEDPTKLTLLGSPASTNGDFPVTVAVSSSLGIICVGNTGVRSGVSCASYSANGIGAFDALRSIPLGQTNPATGPLNGIADVFSLKT